MVKADLKKLKKNLPKNPGILRKEEYFNSAVIIPLVNIENEYHFLFEKRAAEIRQGGEICFPGGEFDKDDKSFKETAIREAMEELGIERNKINILGALDTFIGPMGVTVDSFIAELKIKNLSELKIDKKEVEKIFTIPVSFFQNNPPEIYHVRMEFHSSFIDQDGISVELFPVKKLNLPKRYHAPWGGIKHKVLVYKTENEIIWGITAALVHEAAMRIKDSE
jgi:peroxisomal coenzyme A diphosphatase NUDT7